VNYLAHFYLANGDKGLMFGNFIADHIVGKRYLDFPEPIQKGVLQHRAIDTFTDEHPVVLESKKRLRPIFHKFSPVIADVFYDYLLAKRWSEYSNQNLEDFTLNAYSVINESRHLLPEKAAFMFSYMERDNWLYNYRKIEGIDRALSGMSRRTIKGSKMELAAEYLRKDETLYLAEFDAFFPELKAYALGFVTQ
jgi:acyl carrier protein phosphodiesterase